MNWTDRPEDLPDEPPVDPSDVWKGGGGSGAPMQASKSPAADKPAAETEALF